MKEAVPDESFAVRARQVPGAYGNDSALLE